MDFGLKLGKVPNNFCNLPPHTNTVLFCVVIWFSTLTITKWEYWLALIHVENALCPVSVNIQPRFHLCQNERTYPSHSYANCLWWLIKSKITCLPQITLTIFVMIYFPWMFDLYSYFIWLWTKSCIKFHKCEGVTSRNCSRSTGLNCHSSRLTKMLILVGASRELLLPSIHHSESSISYFVFLKTSWSWFSYFYPI